MRGRAPQGEEKSVLGAVGKASGGARKAGGKTERVTGTALMASGAAALGGQDRSGIELRPRNGSMCEHFWGVPRRAAKRWAHGALGGGRSEVGAFDFSIAVRKGDIRTIAWQTCGTVGRQHSEDVE